MALLEKVKKRLQELNVPFQDVQLSPKPDKKIMVVINGKKIHFGAKNSYTYLEGADNKKKESYQARASKITNKNGEYTYKIKYTPNYLAYHVLWTRV